MAIRQQPKTYGQALSQFADANAGKLEDVTVLRVGSGTADIRTASGTIFRSVPNGAPGVQVGDTATLQTAFGGRQTIVSGGTGASGTGGGGALFSGGAAVTYSGAPSTASYLTLGSDATLSSERVFTKGNGLTATDGGAGSTYTLTVGQGNGITVNANDVAVNQGYSFTWTATHDFTNGFYIGSDVLLSRIAANTLALGTGDSFQSQDYISGYTGWKIFNTGSSEWNNVIVRGEMRTSVFRVSEITASAGTFGVWDSAATVYETFVTAASIGGSFTFKAKNSDTGGMLIDVNDVCQVKNWNGTSLISAWFTVTARTNNTTYTTYTATLNSGSNGVAVTAGAAIAVWGASGSGFITLSADGTIGSSPNISIGTHAGSPWSSQTLVARIGNLDGSYGVTGTYYGIGLGDHSAGNYLKYDDNPGAGGGFAMVSGTDSMYLDGDGMRLKMPVSTSITYADQSAIGWATSPATPGSLLSYISAARSTGGVFPSNTLRVFSQDTGASRQALVEISAYNNTTGGGPAIFVAAKGDGSDEITATADTITLTGSTVADKINVGTATGAGTGVVKGKNSANAALLWVIDSGTSSAQSAGFTLADRGTSEWSVYKDSSNNLAILEEGAAVRALFNSGGGLNMGTASGAAVGGVKGRNSADAGLLWFIDSGSTAAQSAGFTLADRGTSEWSVYKDSSNELSFLEEGAAVRMTLKNGGAVHVPGSVGVGTSTTQAKLHTYDTDGGTLHNWRTTGLAGTRVTIVPNGTGDCTQACAVFGVAHDSSGNSWELRGALESGVSAGSEQTVQVAGDATDNIHVKVKTDGQVEIVRNAGARTWSVCLSAWWR